MAGQKTLVDRINEIEVFIDNCNNQTFNTKNKSVPSDEMHRMLNELKLSIPTEIERCRKVMRNKEAILASARTRSDSIINDSLNEAKRLVDQNQITELAKARADEIVDDARKQAQEIIKQANEEAREVRLGSLNYTKNQIENMKNFLSDTLEAESENYKNLVDSLSDNVQALENNVSEVNTSINLLNQGIVPTDSLSQNDDGYGNSGENEDYEQNYDDSNYHDNNDNYDENEDYDDESSDYKGHDYSESSNRDENEEDEEDEEEDDDFEDEDDDFYDE